MESMIVDDVYKWAKQSGLFSEEALQCISNKALVEAYWREYFKPTSAPATGFELIN